MSLSVHVPELLLPAGNGEKLRTALLYGAHAVYAGGLSGNLRAATEGIGPNELPLAVREAERHSAKLYFCLNSLPVQRDMGSLPQAIEAAAEAGVHGFIIADAGVLRLARKYAPRVPVHLSTQANTTNAEAVAFWRDAGASRVNLARELTCRDIFAIRKALPDVELEVFIHGAMCLAVSGQCLLSAWLNRRPANQGRCTQPCRFAYRAIDAAARCSLASMTVEEELRDGERLWDIRRNEGYSEFWAPDDLCLLPYLPWFISSRITSLKVEGRTKSSSYVAHVADAYRSAIDAAVNGAAPARGRTGEGVFSCRQYLPDLVRTASRPLSTGFFIPHERRRVGDDMSVEARPLLARIIEPAKSDMSAWHIEVRGRWEASRPVEAMLPGMRRPVLAAGDYAFENHRGERSVTVNSGTRGVLHASLEGILPGVFIRGLGGA